MSKLPSLWAPTLWSNNQTSFFDDAFKQMDIMFDSVFGTSFPAYPPTNVLAEKQYNGELNSYQDGTVGDYVIEVALSGYSRDDVKVNIHERANVRYLTIESDGINATRDNVAKWYNRSIAGRAFKLSYTLAKNVVIESAELTNGLLRIRLGVEKVETQDETITPVTLKATESK